jgi:membrane protein DedA with SNARE-associated domain
MNDRFHVGTFLWGAVLTIAGAALAAAGFGWWDLSSIDLRYVAPAFVILVGVVILLGSLMPSRPEQPKANPSA